MVATVFWEVLGALRSLVSVYVRAQMAFVHALLLDCVCSPPFSRLALQSRPVPCLTALLLLSLLLGRCSKFVSPRYGAPSLLLGLSLVFSPLCAPWRKRRCVSTPKANTPSLPLSSASRPMRRRRRRRWCAAGLASISTGTCACGRACSGVWCVVLSFFSLFHCTFVVFLFV